MFRHTRHVFLDDTGSATIEQALCMIIVAVLAGVLLAIVGGPPVRQGIADLVEHSLEFSG